MALRPGTQLGPYRIDSPLGAGGMGEVYRATDTKLGREVAIKIASAELTDAGRLARFDREARMLAALNHPHIATLYGWEPLDSGSERAGATMLVMELVEGPTLEAKLARPLPLPEVVRIGSQIADALAAAHDQGIVHRDLKPANIKLTRTGAVKVLDFGIAKPIDDARAVAATATMTEAGQIIGTAAYMSPEQTRGVEVDARTDVWAFGCVLCEMVTGRRAFDGATRSDVTAAVLEREPDWSSVPANCPAGVRLLLQRCLQKDAAERFRSMADARMILTDAVGAGVRGSASDERRSSAALIAMTAAAIIATAAAVWLLTRTPEQRAGQLERLEIVTPAASAINIGTTTSALAVSPDGRQVSYVTTSASGSGGQLMVRAIDDVVPRRVEGAERVRDHAFSPDGRWLAYLVSVTNGGLAKIPVGGGAAVMLARIPGIRGPSWADDSSIVFSTVDVETGVLRVSSEGGTPEVLTKPDASKGEADHLFPSALPSGRGVLFIVHPVGAGDRELAVRDARDGTIKRLVSGAVAARYSAGQLLYVANGTLYARPFDLERLAITGEPIILAERVLTGTAGGAFFDVARNGTIVYVAASAANDPPRRLVWVDRQGNETPLGAPALPYRSVRVSPRGDRIALGLADDDQDIHTWDIERQTMARVTTGARADFSMAWTVDGKELVYVSRSGPTSTLMRQMADGSAQPQTLMVSPTRWMPFGMTSDGRTLVGHVPSTNGWQLFDTPLDRPADASRLNTVESATKPALSPNGKFVAHAGFESGTQVYVRPFPDLKAARWRVSNAGGDQPIWHPGGRELIYWSPEDGSGDSARSDGEMMAVGTDTTAPAFKWDSPRRLFSTAPSYMRSPQAFDISHDGQRLLMIKNLEVAQNSGGRIQVMLNALKR